MLQKKNKTENCAFLLLSTAYNLLSDSVFVLFLNAMHMLIDINKKIGQLYKSINLSIINQLIFFIVNAYV